jgi:hypothetical protein
MPSHSIGSSPPFSITRKPPAQELAALYHERWEIETALDELKTHLRGAKIVLRSKTPELVRQEFYGLMMAHFAIRSPCGWRIGKFWRELPLCCSLVQIGRRDNFQLMRDLLLVPTVNQTRKYW